MFLLYQLNPVSSGLLLPQGQRPNASVVLYVNVSHYECLLEKMCFVESSLTVHFTACRQLMLDIFHSFDCKFTTGVLGGFVLWNRTHYCLMCIF
jgi:hypothetical protein